MAKKKSDKTLAKIQATQALASNVSIKVKEGRHTVKTINVHNEATFNLLYGLLLAMGPKRDADYLPRYLSVGNGHIETDNIFNANKLGNDITLLRTDVIANFKRGPFQEDNNKKVKVIYQCIMPKANISSSTITELGLFGTQTGNSLVAVVELKDTDKITLNQGQSLVIEWTFVLQNVQDIQA